MNNTISPYAVALFLHIVGTLGLFAALGLEWMSLSYLQRAATSEQAREWLKVFSSLRRLYPISWIAILIPGLYMTATVWGWVAWIVIALVSVVLLAGLGIVLTRRQMAPIVQAIAVENGPLSDTLHKLLDNPLLWASLRTRTAIALGIVFLMTVKPDLLGSLITVSVAVVLGMATSLPAGSRDREQVQANQAGDRL